MEEGGRESIIDPPSASLGHRTFVVAQRLFCREEAATVIARELADLAVLRDFVTEPIVLSRETLGTAKGAGEG